MAVVMAALDVGTAKPVGSSGPAFIVVIGRAAKAAFMGTETSLGRTLISSAALGISLVLTVRRTAGETTDLQTAKGAT